MTERRVGDDDLHAYVDGALSPERRNEVEAHLAATPADAARVDAYRRLNADLHRLYDSVLDEPVAAPTPRVAAPPRRWLVPAIAASMLLAGIGGGWLLRDLTLPEARRTTIVREIRDADWPVQAARAHTAFVVERRHPVEVPADEEAHLVQWLSNRLGAGIAAPKLAYFNFALVGGRLLPRADGGVAGQFMYERRPPGADAATLPVRLTLYVKPAPAGTSGAAFQVVADGDTTVFYWLDQRFGYALVGTLPREEMLPLARAAFRQLER